MNKALRFVWLSLLTLICGVASAGTVVFDPTQDATNAESVTKDGITFKRMGGDRKTLDAYDKDGTTCWWFNGRYGIESTEKRIRSITFECLSGSFCDYVTSYGSYFTKDVASSTETKVVYTANDATGYDPAKGVLRFGGSGKNAFITKVTVQYVGGDDPDPDPGIGSLAIVFDPIRDATSAESVTKDGITFKRMGGDRTTLDAYDKDGTTCWWFNGRYGIESTEKRIRSITFECLSGSFCDYVTSYGSYFTKDVASSTETKVVFTANDATGYDPTKGVLRFGASGKNAFITKVTVVYVGGEDPGTGPGTGGEAGQTTTIAQLAQGGVNVASATIQFTNAQVVYAEENNYIIRENNQALDILNTSLNLKQGQYLTGTVVLNVNYNSGILTTSDVTGLTDATKLAFSGDELNEPLPILCATIAEMTNHPGDLVMIENRKCNKSYLGFYISAYESASYKAFYFSNGDKAGLVANKNFDITAWNNSVLQYYNYNYPQGKVIKAEPVITTLAAPTILGEETFTTTTTVTITSTEKVAKIYYTLNGEEPTQASTLYEGPFVLDKTATVKAIAVYKTVTSPVASKDFQLIDLSVPKTIRDLAVMEKNLESVTVRFDNAQVVYGEGKNYILREKIEGKNYALDVLNTQLPLQVGATVSGTVKLQVNFKPNPAENNGVLTTADIAETLNHNLAITSGASVMPIPLEVSIKEVRNYPGDLLVVADGEWVIPYYGDPLIYGSENPTWPYGATYYVYVSNHSDYTYSNSDKPDVMLWYNDVYTDGKSPLAIIIGEKETAEYKVTEVGWATFIVPFDYDKPDGLTIYECTSVNEDGKLVVEERDYLKANTPYLLKGAEANQILEGYAAKHADTYTNGVMTGVYSDQEAPANSYILLNHPDEAGLAFYFVPDGITAYVDANRCYVNPRAGGLKSILFPDDETNGVTNANALDSTLVDVYTTAGVKVKHQVEKGKALNDLPAGLYIINNKKIVKK